jgi:hypothetical protein
MKNGLVSNPEIRFDMKNNWINESINDKQIERKSGIESKGE